MIRTLFKREFLAFFRSPVAYVFLVVFLLLTSIFGFFIRSFFEGGSASLNAFFYDHVYLFSFFGPAIGMRLWAEERRSGSFELLFTLPITPLQAVLAKFFAGWAFFICAILLTFPIVITVAYLGNPDWGVIASSYLGSILLAGTITAISCFNSALTKNQIVAFVLAFFECAVLVLIGDSFFTQLLSTVLPVPLVDAIANLGFGPNFQSMTRGLIGLSNVVYFVGVAAFALFLNVVAIER